MKQAVLCVAAVALGVVLGVVGLAMFIRHGIVPALSMPGRPGRPPKTPRP